MGLRQAPGAPWDDAAPWRIDVEIGELVLDGFERVDRDAVAGAFCEELGRLLRRDAGRLLAQGAAGDPVAGDLRAAAELPRGMSPRRLGQSLARAAFGAVDGVARAGDAPATAVPAVLTRGATAPSGDTSGPAGPGSPAPADAASAAAVRTAPARGADPPEPPAPADAASAAAVRDEDVAPSAGQAHRGAL